MIIITSWVDIVKTLFMNKPIIIKGRITSHIDTNEILVPTRLLLLSAKVK
jgi:hypothetical protein